MRIGIDYRMLSAGKNTVNRGLGRYTQQQIREAVRHDSRNEYVLFCHADADTSLILPEIRSAPNVSIATVEMGAGWTREHWTKTDSLLRYSENYQSWIVRQRIDIYHATTTFLLSDLTASHFDACPRVTTFYDLIPLIFPHHYLPQPSLAHELYIRGLHFLTRSEHQIAISKSARDDAIAYLGIPADRIDIAYPIPDPWFRQLKPQAAADALRELRRRVALPDQYLMSVTYPHLSKNVERMLEGFALQPKQQRQRMPLVLTFMLMNGVREYLRTITDRLGISDEVILTDFVTEQELVALYNQATALLHLSRYEGFGMPVVEAMRCGTPVITTTVSSLPEVGGDAAILVDPDDVQGIADAIQRVASDRELREHMRERGFAHAARFSPEQLGRTTVAAYERLRASATAPRTEPPRPRVALWSPLPPQRSGIADHTADVLLDQLASRYDVEIFVDDGYLPSTDLLQRHPVHHYSAFERRSRQAPFDSCIYQIGMSSYHLYMYPFLQKHRGIVTLHDLHWGAVLFHQYAEQGRTSDFLRELEALEGAAARAEFEAILGLPPEEQARRFDAFFDTHYLLGRIVEGSQAVIVHAPEFERDLRERFPGSRLTTIPLAMPDPWGETQHRNPQLIRDQLGIARGTFVIGVFGLVDRVKRIDSCIRALAALQAAQPDSLLLIVGPQIDPGYARSLRELAQQLGIAERILLVDYAQPRDFSALMLACDTIVNLRYPSRKQMSATLVQALAAGKPVIISPLPEWSFIPESCCWRVAPDDSEVEQLAARLAELADCRELRQTRGAASRAFYDSTCTPYRVGSAYDTVIEGITGRQSAKTRSAADKGDAAVPPLQFNKVCNYEDFQNPELAETIRDVFSHEMPRFTPEFPRGAEYRKYWEIGMSVLALRKLGMLRPDARILGIGAGTETTIFYLCNHVGQVFATDLYLDPSMWNKYAPGFMLIEPERVAPYPFDASRLVVQHMDGRVLRYPDSSFDGIFSSGSIEHFGSLEYVANAAYEMGRVLKPGGILTLSTEFRISGPPNELGMPGTILFTPETLTRQIIEASGLELVDPLDLRLSETTLQSERALSLYIADSERQMTNQGRYPRAGEIQWSHYPHLVLVHDGFVFCSIHLTLRKPEHYPAVDNSWARPSPETVAMVSEAAPTAQPQRPQQPQPTLSQIVQTAEGMPTPNVVRSSPADAETRAALAEWEQMRLRGWYNTTLRRLPKPVNYLVRTIDRVMVLGRFFGVQSRIYNGMLSRQAELAEQIAALAGRLARLESQTFAVPSDVLPLRDDLAQLNATVQGISAEQLRKSGLDTRQFEEARGQIAALQRTIGEFEASLAARHSATEQQSARLSSHEERLRELTSVTRYLQQQIEGTIAEHSAPRDARLSADDIPHLLRLAEQQQPGLASGQAIELTVGGSHAEPLVVAGVGYLDGRLSSQGSSYRAPNDVWYHIELDGDWRSEQLFENARGRLASGGWLVVLGDPGQREAPPAAGLEHTHSGQVELTSGAQVSLHIYRRV